MKKQILLGAFAIFLSTVSCSEREEVAATSSSVNQVENTLVSRNPDGAGASFTFRLGRASKNCAGWGICELSAAGIVIVKGPKKILKLEHSFEEETPPFQMDAYYRLDSTDELNGLDDTTFYVDQDFYTTDEEGNNFIIHRGEYSFDPSIGEFGGYAIHVSKI